MARIEYAIRAGAPPAVAGAMDRLEAGGWPLLNVFRAVLRSPAIGPEFLRMGSAILASDELSPRLRELAIVRVARLTRSNYEWVHHARLALRCGATQAQLDAVAADRTEADVFDARERALLDYTDEVTLRVKASAQAFAAMREHFSEQQVVEITLTIGYYNMVSRILESLEIELEG